MHGNRVFERPLHDGTRRVFCGSAGAWWGGRGSGWLAASYLAAVLLPRDQLADGGTWGRVAAPAWPCVALYRAERASTTRVTMPHSSVSASSQDSR